MSAPVTILIPAFNAERRIHVPLSALASQDARTGPFDVLIVDNASTDGTRRIVEQSQATRALRQRGCAVTIVQESRPGLTAARLRGIREASSDLICLLDDDTEPASTYVAAGIAAFSEPDIGLLISRVFPAFECDPPPAVARRQYLLAINSHVGESRLEWPADDSLAPTLGAGMWVRKVAIADALSRGPQSLLSDRVGTALRSGGDMEIGILVGRAGYRRVYVPALALRHHIPRTRFNWRYFSRLIVGIVRSELSLRDRYSCPWRRVQRLSAIAALTVATLMTPVLIAIRTDGLREAVFVLASRWGRVLGPYRSTTDDFPSESLNLLRQGVP